MAAVDETSIMKSQSEELATNPSRQRKDHGASSAAVHGLSAETLFKELPGTNLRVPFAEGRKLSKVTVVGTGNVGMACAQTILTQNIADEIALVDHHLAKAQGEMLDLQHAAAFLPAVNIMASDEYSVSAGSDICIVTAGARSREGESRLSLVDRNVTILKSIIPELAKHSPECVLLIISNPVDILTWVAWKLSGFPPNRVLGSGTNLDTSRFRFLIADHLNVNAQNVHAQILGEHGDSSVPLWSSVSIGGVPLSAFLKDNGLSPDPATLKEAHMEVVNGAYKIIKLKGYTSWAIGYSVASIVTSVVRNQRHIHPVSVLAKGFHDIDEEVFLSLPAKLGRSGVLAVTNSVLSLEEKKQLKLSAKTLWEIQSKLKL